MDSWPLGLQSGHGDRLICRWNRYSRQFDPAPHANRRKLCWKASASKEFACVVGVVNNHIIAVTVIPTALSADDDIMPLAEAITGVPQESAKSTPLYPCKPWDCNHQQSVLDSIRHKMVHWRLAPDWI